VEVKTVYLTYKNHFIIVLIKYMFFNIIKYFFKTIKVIIMLKKHKIFLEIRRVTLKTFKHLRVDVKY
jgi:hypothetical protein